MDTISGLPAVVRQLRSGSRCLRIAVAKPIDNADFRSRSHSKSPRCQSRLPGSFKARFLEHLTSTRVGSPGTWVESLAAGASGASSVVSENGADLLDLGICMGPCACIFDYHYASTSGGSTHLRRLSAATLAGPYAIRLAIGDYLALAHVRPRPWGE